LFSFGDEGTSQNAVATVNVPKAVNSKAVLFATFATSLHFRDYFGKNWDAFEECIRDLSWLPKGPIVVKHDDVPLANDIRNTTTYLLILNDAARRMSDDHPISVVFPADCRDHVCWFLRLGNKRRSE
jgi:RNAse (barnase) inhibitor barstar